DADGIFAQSVGGGGGAGGKGASSAGGAQSPAAAAQSLTNLISGGLGQNAEQVVKLADGVFKVGDGQLKNLNNIESLFNLFGEGSAAKVGDDDDDGDAQNLTITVGIGGKGGSGGDGGTVTVENHFGNGAGGDIVTSGA